jgi:DNA-binding MarR family transcriptional regulator
MTDPAHDPDPLERARGQWLEHGLEGADYVVAMTSIVRAHQVVESRVERILKPFELNMMRYNALSTLRFSTEGRPMGRVAWGLMIHPATVTAVVDHLEKAGLVERRPHPDDRRAVLVVITKKGMEVADEATRALTEDLFGMDGVSPTEARTITKALTPLRKAAGDIKSKSAT